MLPTFVDEVLKEIVKLKNRYPKLIVDDHRVHTLEMELRFLKMFIWFLPKRSLTKPYMRVAVGIRKPKLSLYVTKDRPFHRTISKLLQEVEVCKEKIRGQRLRLFQLSSQHKFSSSNELLQFIRCTIMNLRNLVLFNSSAIVSVRIQVKALIKKLRILRDFVNATGKWLYFGTDIQDWSLKVACLSTLYWVDQMEEATATASQMNAVLNDLLSMVKCHSLVVARLCHLKASELLAFDRFQIGEVIESFVDFILPTGFMKVLRLELTFLIVFLMDPPVGEMYAKVEAFASEILSLICSVAAEEVKEITDKASNVRDFREKTIKLMKEVRMLYIHNPNSSRPHFPITNALAFFDSLLEKFGNLMDILISKASYIPFAKDQFFILHEELVSFRHFLKKVEELQTELEEIKDLQMRITDVAYQVEYVIDSCQMTMFPIWYNVVCLSSVMEEMKFIKSKIQEIMHKQIHKVEVNNPNVDSYSSHPYQGHTTGPDEVVGFKDETEKIIDLLTRGSKRLDIVSIVGMPGQGKTTLAKKVYNSPHVHHHFTKQSWCFVTQIYSAEKLLMDILSDIGAGTHNLKYQDIAEKVWRCLKGHRYLIILDDIWDITAWNAIKESFPDDNKGSRVLFTSRNDFGFNPYLLRPLSDEESVELLKCKLFYKNDWPSNISHFVEKILQICNGLPLALVVVSGLLIGTSGNLYQWGEIIDNLNAKIPSEGCMDILELSYKNLPDFLKPCFLYLGAEVKRNEVFKVKKLIQIWISEGFVQKPVDKSLEDVANEYLEGLVSRSLVIVNKRSSTGEGIKECRIHDLVLELCLRKANEERFMLFPEFYRYSSEVIYDPYRLCISNIAMAGVFSENNITIVHLTPLMKTTGPIVRSLLLPSRHFSRSYHFNSDFYWRLMLVRVLDLGNVYFFEFPDEVVSLIHLRYLSIWFKLEVIPSSIAKLCNLENLHMAGNMSGHVFPVTIWKMKTLRNICDLGGAAILLNDHDANACPELDDLHSFSTLFLRNVKDAKKILSRFPHVRKLKLEFSESWKCSCGLFQVLHLLRKLEKLNLRYYVGDHGDHPCPFNLPATLKKLTLSWFSLEWSEISTIGKLPNLEVLKLLDSPKVEGRWDVGDEEFLKVKYLELSDLGIMIWKASNSSFPCLEKLVVRLCPFLVKLPSIFKYLSTLKMIEIRMCHRGVEMSANRICDVQQDMGNEGLGILIEEDVLSLKSRESMRADNHLLCPFRRFNGIRYSGLYGSEVQYEVKFGNKKGSCELGLENKKGFCKLGLKKNEGFRRSHVQTTRRIQILTNKHNYQLRQAIMSRHHKQETKGDV